MRRPLEVICGREGFGEPSREIRTGDIMAERKLSQAQAHGNFYILQLEARALESHFCFPHPPTGVTPKWEVFLLISPFSDIAKAKEQRKPIFRERIHQTLEMSRGTNRPKELTVGGGQKIPSVKTGLRGMAQNRDQEIWPTSQIWTATFFYKQTFLGTQPHSFDYILPMAAFDIKSRVE